MNRALPLLGLTLLAGCSVMEPEQVTKAKKSISHSMLDPEATQFRDVRVCPADSKVVEGEANGKNAFGAYVGFEPFYYSPDANALGYGSHNFSELMRRCFGTKDENSLRDAEPVEVLKTEQIPRTEPAKLSEARGIAEPPEGGGPMDDIGEGDLDSAVAKSRGEARCWMDYCPCDTSDPDYGYLDIPNCRNLRAGLPVSDEVMSIGASGRDARRALREFERDNP